MSSVTETSLLRVGVIGLNNHAARLIELLSQSKRVSEVVIFYDRDRPTNDRRITADFADIFGCDAVIIASPTSTHYEYLKRLEPFVGYILVEKPAVATLEESQKLRSWPPDQSARLMVNYNFVRTPVACRIRKLLHEGILGSPIFLFITSSHGLAFQSSYAENWRASGSGFGIAEVVGVHFIHLACALFGPPIWHHVSQSNFSGHGENGDTAQITMSMQNQSNVNILVSYAAPFSFGITLMGTEAIYRYDGEQESLQKPRDHIDNSGRFVAAPIEILNRISHPQNWRQGLEESLEFFLATAASKGHFSLSDLIAGLDAMSPIFSKKGAI